MSLIELRDIGKIYVSDNNVSVGIRGINARLDIGEFVAVTGASGSGKTTLLNVLSGMDTYEEGEMLICGEPTSHYIQTDWEEYREKYVSFIFQDYNILESFTVLQNVELALTHIRSKKERRKRAEELIDKVGLTRQKYNKGSRLSGGQKQRTVIARALAKDSPIILADEPTGNLDSKSSAEIIKLLKEVSSEKLVVVVTHSFDEVKDVATRELRIFDGAIERDTEIKTPTKLDPESVITTKATEKKPLELVADGIELGVHRFFAKPKLAVLMSVIMTFAILSTFYITANMIGRPDLMGTTYVFTPMDGRVAITRVDGEPLSDREVKEIAEKYGANSYLSFDGALESKVRILRPNSDYSTMGFKYKYGVDGCKPSVGRLPSEGEVFLKLPISMKPYFGEDSLLIDRVFSTSGTEFAVSGVEYFYDNTKDPEIAVREEDFLRISMPSYTQNVESFIEAEIELANNELMSASFGGQIVVDQELTGRQFYILGMYDNKRFDSVKRTLYTMYDYSYMTGYVSYDFECEYALARAIERENAANSDANRYKNPDYGIFVSAELLEELVQNTAYKLYPQASLFFDNDAEAKAVCEDIENEGYFALTTDVTYFDITEKIFSLIEAVVLIVIWLFTIVFLAFFLSLCLRKNIDTLKTDVGILRSMGIKISAVKISMYSIVGLAMIPALIVFATVAAIIYTSPELNQLVPFIHAPEYILIIAGALIISVVLAGKNNKRIFRQSVRKTLKGGNS